MKKKSVIKIIKDKEMIKLVSKSDFSSNKEIVKEFFKFKKKYNIEGVELIKFTNNSVEEIKDIIIGYHLRFFPMWIDLYLEKYEEIEKEIKDINEIAYLCGGKNKKELIEFYKKEVELGKKLGVKYLVLHGGGVRPSETYTYKFSYDKKEIINYLSEIINEIFDPEKGEEIELLIENLWWPGIKLISKEEIEMVLSKVKYKNIGFMLDLGHMLNTNLDIKNLSEGTKYILKNINALDEYKKYIKGIHMNASISGEYVKNMIRKGYNKENIYKHIQKIDMHNVYNYKGVKKILKKLKIKYLVYEFLYKNLDKEIEKQEKYIY